MPIKAYYNEPVSSFLEDNADRILGILTIEHHHALEEQALGLASTTFHPEGCPR
jgi:hypothetical protein